MLLSDRLTFLGNKKQLKVHATGTKRAGKCMQLAIRRETKFCQRQGAGKSMQAASSAREKACN